MTSCTPSPGAGGSSGWMMIGFDGGRHAFSSLSVPATVPVSGAPL